MEEKLKIKSGRQWEETKLDGNGGRPCGGRRKEQNESERKTMGEEMRKGKGARNKSERQWGKAMKGKN